MPGYRAYLICAEGHFRDVVALDCADDTAASEQARQLVGRHDVELWQRDRKVARFDRKPRCPL